MSQPTVQDMLSRLVTLRTELEEQALLGTYTDVFDRVIVKLSKIVVKHQLATSKNTKPTVKK